MLSFRFYLQNVDLSEDWEEIDEPIGWDGSEFSLTRSNTYEGLENVYSNEFEFYDHTFTGRTKLIEAWDYRGFDSNVNFKIEIYCDGVLTDTIIGYLNFLTYEREGNTVKLQFEESSFSRKFKSRIDTVVNLDSNTGIDGNSLTDIERKTVKLHSKEIKLDSSYNLSDSYLLENLQYTFEADQLLVPPYQAWDSSNFNISDGGSGCETKSETFYVQIPLDTIILQDDQLLDSFNISFGVTKDRNPCAEILQTGELTIRVKQSICALLYSKWNGSILRPKNCDCPDGSITLSEFNEYVGNFEFTLQVQVGGDTQEVNLSSGSKGSCTEYFYGDTEGKNTYLVGSASPFDTFFEVNDQSTSILVSHFEDRNRFTDIDETFTFNATAGQNIYILIKCEISNEFELRASPTKVQFYCESYLQKKEDNFISFTSKSTNSASEVTGYMIYEALNRVSESITGRTDAIRSDFFGRTDSLPKLYDSVGCGAQTLLTNGKAIRNMIKADETPYAINASFSELFQAVSVPFCLGFRIERDGNLDYIRIEPIDYFYTQDVFFTVSEPESIREEVAKNRLYNDLEIGYNKWEIENLNGIDEFNTKHNYAVSTTNIKQKLPATTNYVTGGYAIEMTRRIQYSSNPTTDWKYDDDNFLIALNRIEVTTDVYEDAEYTYQPGQVSERNELFTSVENVISPETCFNLRFSPARSAMYWFKKMAPAVIKKPSQVLKFQSGTGNILLKTLVSDSDTCSITSGYLQEDQNIDASTTIYQTLDRIALHQGILINVEFPLNYGEFVTIRQNSNKTILVNCGDRTYTGFIDSLKFKPLVSGGKAEASILVSNCYAGEYDDSFSDDFNTGVC